MALPLQDPAGTALPVSWVRGDAADPLILSSQQGYFTTSDYKNGVQYVAYPVELFEGILHDKPGDTVIVILNTLRTPLDLVEMYVEHGTQSGYPAVSDLKGRTMTTHRIPASRTNPLDGSMMYGAGMWAFSDVLVGTSGAMKFCMNGKLTDDKDQTQAVGPFLGVSWSIHQTPSDRTGVTADVDRNYGKLKDFYDRTAGANGVSSEVGQEVAIMAAYKYSNTVATQSVAVYVRYKLPGE